MLKEKKKKWWVQGERLEGEGQDGNHSKWTQKSKQNYREKEEMGILSLRLFPQTFYVHKYHPEIAFFQMSPYIIDSSRNLV